MKGEMNVANGTDTLKHTHTHVAFTFVMLSIINYNYYLIIVFNCIVENEKISKHSLHTHT